MPHPVSFIWHSAIGIRHFTVTEPRRHRSSSCSWRAMVLALNSRLPGKVQLQRRHQPARQRLLLGWARTEAIVGRATAVVLRRQYWDRSAIEETMTKSTPLMFISNLTAADHSLTRVRSGSRKQTG